MDFLKTVIYINTYRNEVARKCGGCNPSESMDWYII